MQQHFSADRLTVRTAEDAMGCNAYLIYSSFAAQGAETTAAPAVNTDLNGGSSDTSRSRRRPGRAHDEQQELSSADNAQVSLDEAAVIAATAAVSTAVTSTSNTGGLRIVNPATLSARSNGGTSRKRKRTGRGAVRAHGTPAATAATAATASATTAAAATGSAAAATTAAAAAAASVADAEACAAGSGAVKQVRFCKTAAVGATAAAANAQSSTNEHTASQVYTVTPL
jgi:hypothetical protein